MKHNTCNSGIVPSACLGDKLCASTIALFQVWLAAQQPGVAGVVLHSPLLSGVRVFNPTIRYVEGAPTLLPGPLPAC